MEKGLILVVDDESKIRRLVSLYLKKNGYEVLGAENGVSAMRIVRDEAVQPELVILDYMMPKMDGFAFLETYRSFSRTPVMLLSARGELASKTEAFARGADDYLVKPFALEEMMARIEAILRRSRAHDAPAPNPVLENGCLKMWPLRRECRCNETEIRLADTEFRLLELLMKNVGCVLTHEQILGKVWGPQYIGELNYLRVSFTRIRKKLAEAGLPKTVIYSYSGIGYAIADLKKDFPAGISPAVL
jgi:DNA-binding response OmpR family regulator